MKTGEPSLTTALRCGGTPFVELTGLLPEDCRGTRLFAKLEAVNPGGSLKDRSAGNILRRAVARGDLSERRLLDSSSGNAAIAYAMNGAALGVGVTLVVPGNATRERLERIAAYGAEIVRTDPLEGYDHAVREARRLARERPDRYWYANQYANDDNWRAHYETTGVEIVEQCVGATGAPPDAFVCGVGTGGTLTGVGRRLREGGRTVHLAIADPERFPGIEGLKPLGEPGDLVPEILDESLIDARVPVRIEEALARCRELAARGLFVGPSSGAYVHAAIEVARTGRYRVVTTILNDTGERYHSTGMWEGVALSASIPSRRVPTG